MDKHNRIPISWRAIAAGFAMFVAVASVSVIRCIAQSQNSLSDTPRRGNVRVTTPSPGVFPITALGVFSSHTGPQREYLAGIEECGFNLCMQITNTENTVKMLEYMEGTNLKFIPGDFSFVIQSKPNHNWKKEMLSFIDRFKDNPNVAGWVYYDEPQWSLLQEVKDRYDVLLSADDKHFVSINFVGELVKSHTGLSASVPAYLDSIQNVFGSTLDIWSFDCYPIWIRNGNFLVRYNDFFTALDAYAQKSKQTGVPMWTYCESMAFNAKHHDIPPVTLPQLTFQAFSGLAYGSQGIVYWTYSMRPSNSIETYVSALIDRDGNRTPAWYVAQNVNRQIRALTPVFLGAEMVEVRHTGNIPYNKVRALIEDFGPLRRLTNEEKGVLASHLRNNGKDYLLIVNHDVQNKQKVRLTFKNNIDIMELKPTSSGSVSQKKVKNNYSVTLAPGGYSLFEWE